MLSSRLKSLGGHLTFFNGVVTGTEMIVTDPPASVPPLTDRTTNREERVPHYPSSLSG